MKSRDARSLRAGQLPRRYWQSSASALLYVALVAFSGCGPDPARGAGKPQRAVGVSLLAELRLPAITGSPADGERDGEGDGPIVVGGNLRALATAERATLVALPPPPATRHPIVCDILGFGDALYVAHVVETIDQSGARIHRYALNESGPQRWTLAFDWDRVGAEPDFIGGVGGEGITRLRAIDGRIYATDSDTPGPGGYGLTDARYEDYLFVSDRRGAFPPLGPGMTPPANTRVLPLSFHVFDAIRYRGALVVSGGTGSFPSGPFPGGLWVGGTDDPVLPVRFELGRNLGVVRTTYMHRFGGRLYIGFQNNRRRGRRLARFDLAVLSGDPREPDTPAPVVARVTPRGGWLTRRFASADGTLYWVASRYKRGTAVLFESSDGLTFHQVALPGQPGDVQDIAIVGETRYVLTTRAVYRGSPGHQFTALAPVSAPSPFAGDDQFCSAPLVAYADRLFAGSTVDGGLFEIRAVAP